MAHVIVGRGDFSIGIGSSAHLVFDDPDYDVIRGQLQVSLDLGELEDLVRQAAAKLYWEITEDEPPPSPSEMAMGALGGFAPEETYDW